MRQGGDGSVKGRAVFTRDERKRARETWPQVGAYEIIIPTHPYLPFTGSSLSARLQAEAARTTLEVLKRFILNPLR